MDNRTLFWTRAANGCYEGFKGLRADGFTSEEQVGSVCLFATVNGYTQKYVVDRHLDCVTVPDAIWQRLGSRPEVDGE